MVGHLGRESLAAAAVGNTIFSLMLYFLLGFLTGLDTLAAQAYGMHSNCVTISTHSREIGRETSREIINQFCTLQSK